MAIGISGKMVIEVQILCRLVLHALWELVLQENQNCRSYGNWYIIYNGKWY